MAEARNYETVENIPRIHIILPVIHQRLFKPDKRDEWTEDGKTVGLDRRDGLEIQRIKEKVCRNAIEIVPKV